MPQPFHRAHRSVLIRLHALLTAISACGAF
jgi:hypothetical protein